MSFIDLINQENGKPSVKEIPPPVSDILQQLSIARDFGKSAPVFFKGDEAAKFYIVINGWVKLYHLTSDGQEVVLDMLTGGDAFGTFCILKGSRQPYTAEALADTKLLEINAADLRRHLRENIQLSEWMMTVMADDVQDLLVKNSQMTSMSALQRLGCFLLRFSSWMVGNGGTFSLPYSKSVVAAQLGMNPATFSRILLRLQEYGVYAKGPEVRIENFTSLSAFCCEQCPLCSECSGCRVSRDDGHKADGESRSHRIYA